MHKEVLDITTEPRHLEGRATKWALLAAAVGAIGIIGSYVVAAGMGDDFHYLLETYLVSFAFFLSL